MTSIAMLWFSIALLFIVLTALGFAVFLLARQVGLLHERITPVGALMTHHGPTIGEFAQKFEVDTFNGSSLSIGGSNPSGKRKFVLFTSPTCPVCKKIMPAAISMAKHEKALLDMVIVSDGPMQDHETFIKALKLDGFDYAISAEVGMKYNIGKLPFGLLLDADGKVISKGLCNTREHLESLLNVESIGAPSIQAFNAMQQQG